MTKLYETVENTIPRLRRYALMLTGSREVADDYAQLCLERMIQENLLAHRRDVGSIFFETFHRVVSDAEIRLDTRRMTNMGNLEQELLALPVDQRAAILLVHVEGFSQQQAANITAVPIMEFGRKLSAARAALKQRVAPSVLIIEDELVSQLNMSRLVQTFGHNVCGAASRSLEARAAIEASRPSLVLADVHLGDSPYGGIEACEELCSLYGTPVIYITGHAERVYDRVRRTNVLVLAKPVDCESLRTAMGLALGISAR